MAVTTHARKTVSPSSGGLSFLYQRESRQILYQVVLVVVLAVIFWEIISNASENLRRQNIASGFGFLDRIAGFDIAQHLIEYSNTSTYGRALLVGLWNTVLVAGVGVVLASILGFLAGIARLSSNWLIARIATVYVEVARNCPLLLQLFLWYFGVLKNLPPPRQSLSLEGAAFLNVRGLYLPRPVLLDGANYVVWSFLFGIVATILVGRLSKARQMATGQRLPTFWIGLALIVLLPLLLFFLLGRPVEFEYPALQGFNFQGGITILPEFFALMLGLVFYTGAYIAEIVRAGITAVSKGQKEAASALGLSNGQMLRLVVIPQAMRVIIPPLTSQYLNLTKNSSLAVAIAYPDFTSVAGTVLNQTGQAVEVVLLMMGLYLALSLITSAFMNWFNKRMALVER
jgi:general L-amino acid transport system permease protein